ncbi:MAG TPA: hypothetical protein VI503_05540 [Gaiellaceae bacterium]|nr:hypothetical protein [Gaiellaceae bacterium]
MLGERGLERAVVPAVLAGLGLARKLEAGRLDDLAAETVEHAHRDPALVGQAAAEVLAEEHVEDDEEHPEPLGCEAACLLGGGERLARPGAAGDRHPGLPREHVEHLVLLLGQAEELALLLGELEGERRA